MSSKESNKDYQNTMDMYNAPYIQETDNNKNVVNKNIMTKSDFQVLLNRVNAVLKEVQ